jgi:hypothetical protein
MMRNVDGDEQLGGGDEAEETQAFSGPEQCFTVLVNLGIKFAIWDFSATRNFFKGLEPRSASHLEAPIGVHYWLQEQAHGPSECLA